MHSFYPLKPIATFSDKFTDGFSLGSEELWLLGYHSAINHPVIGGRNLARQIRRDLAEGELGACAEIYGEFHAPLRRSMTTR